MISISAITREIATSATVAVTDLISSGNSKAIGALLERNDKPAQEIYTKILHDEGLEPMWETFFCSILTKISKVLTPNVPEQIAMIPGKLIGAAWHWAITSEQSTNKEILNDVENGEICARNSEVKEGNVFTKFYNNVVKGPSDYVLNLLGMRETNPNFLLYGLSQVGLFGLTSLGLKTTEAEENLPGVNLDSDESLLKNIWRGLGYTCIEQATYAMSQATRFYTDFKDEFKTNAIAKTLANVVNERFFPGHIISGIAASLSTYCFGKIIPKTTAAALAEFPMMLFNRVVNCRRRRATKDAVDENNNIIKNHRFQGGTFDKVLDCCDYIFDPCRNKLLDVITSIFRGNTDAVTFKEELTNSFNIDKEQIRKHYRQERERKQLLEDKKAQISDASQVQVVPTVQVAPAH